MWKKLLRNLSRSVRTCGTPSGVRYTRPTLEQLEKRELLANVVWTGLYFPPLSHNND